jgi:hypothetical protein
VATPHQPFHLSARLDRPACASDLSARLDLIVPAPDAALTTILEGLAAFAAGLARTWGLPVPRP